MTQTPDVRRLYSVIMLLVLSVNAVPFRQVVQYPCVEIIRLDSLRQNDDRTGGRRLKLTDGPAERRTGYDSVLINAMV